jgi:hypothetical protein
MPKTTLVKRDKLYFDQFKYRLTFHLDGAGWTEYRRNILEYKNDYNSRLLENASSVLRGHITPWPGIENIDLGAISKFIDYREKYHPRRSKATIAGIYSYWDSVRIFTNDLTIIHESFDIGGSNYALSEVDKIDVPPGVMLFSRKPKFKYRTYFKEKRVDQQWKDDLKHLITNNSGLVPCGSLKSFLDDPVVRFHGTRLSSSHFIEYDQPSLRMVLDLFFDRGYLRRHFELQQRE